MPYVVHFVGLVYFYDLGREGKIALLPDGRVPPKDTKISPHYGSLFLHEEDIADASDWWKAVPDEELEQECIVELPIPEPSRLTITGMERAQPGGCWPFGSALDDGEVKELPELARQRNLTIVPEWAQTIAQLPLRQGKLKSSLFGNDANGAGVTTLTVDHDGPITILAKPDDGCAFKTLKLKRRTELVLSNTSRLVLSSKPEDTHFRLYARLDVNRNDENLKEAPAPPKLPPLESRHRYIRYLLEHPGTVGEPGCSNTCC